MVRLHLVRHARSARDRGLAAEHWSLGAGASTGAERLRQSGVLPASGVWVGSTEAKAVATARLLTSLPLSLDDGLREAVRGPEWLDENEFERAVRRAFAAPDRAARPGWEPLALTRSRVVRSALHAVTQAGDREVVLVGHGTAWTLLVAALTGDPPDVAGWDTMLMPDHCALDAGPDDAGPPGAGPLDQEGALPAGAGPWRIAAPWGSWSA